MATLKYQISTFNSNTVDGSGNIKAYFRDENSPVSNRSANMPVEATVTGKTPQAVRNQPQGTTWEIWIRLADNSEANVSLMDAVFSEQLGTVYVRMLDGAAVLWRVPVSVISAPKRVPGARSLWVCPVRVPNPLLEADTLITDSELNKQTSPVTMGTAVPGNKTPNGNRPPSPIFTFTADAAKSAVSTLDDAAYSLRGWFVWRSPKAGTNIPVWLMDQSGVAARLATNSSAAGATVLQTTGATTLSVNIAAGATTVTPVSTAGWPAKGLFFVTDSRGAGFHDQGYYTSINAGVLQGVVWLRPAAYGSSPLATVQLGGGIAHTTVQVTAVQPSGIHASGDDMRVSVDDNPNVKRSTVAWNTAASDVVIHMPFIETVVLTLTAPMTASLPAVGSVLSFVEGVSQLGPSGFLAIGDEIVHYSSKSGNGVVLDGARGLWQTTAAAHATTVPVYANPHRYTISVGWAKADVAPEFTLAERAALQLPASSNQVFKWGDQADDPATVFLDRTRPQRAMSWRLGFAKDGNTVSQQISASVTSTILTFKDDVPGDGNAAANYAEITIPMGIKGGTTSIATEWTPVPTAEILMQELWTRDLAGALKLVDQLQSNAAAASRSTIPSTTVYGVQLKARYNVLAGWRADQRVWSVTLANASTVYSDPGPGSIMFKLFVNGGEILTGIALLLNKSAAGSQNVELIAYPDAGGTIDLLNGYMFLGDKVAVPNSGSPAYTIFRFPAGKVRPGTYWCVLQMKDTFTAVVLYGDGPSSSVDGQPGQIGNVIPVYSRGASVWNIQPFAAWGIMLLAGYNNNFDAPIRSDNLILSSAGARTGVTCSFDKASYVIESGTGGVGAPAQSVYVSRNTAFVTNGGAGAMLHINGTIANATPSPAYSLLIDKWMKIGATLVIDCGASTVVYTEDGIAYPLQKSVIAGNQGTWLTLSAGVANAVTYTDASLLAPGQLDFETKYRGLRV